jgi:hypothetical protein
MRSAGKRRVNSGRSATVMRSSRRRNPLVAQALAGDVPGPEMSAHERCGEREAEPVLRLLGRCRRP